MTVKWIGAILVIVGCGSFGFSLVAAHKKEELALRKLISALDLMQCDLQYHLTPLPELCGQAGRETGGSIGSVFLRLSQELSCQISPDVQSCMSAALSDCVALPERTAKALQVLGQSLGRYDLEGQIRGLEAVRENCRRELTELTTNKEQRLRSYQTLGLCAGAALVILFI